MTRATSKLRAYLALAGGAIAWGLLFGRIELIVLAAPLLVAIVIDLTMTGSLEIEAEYETDTDICLQGDELNVRIHVSPRAVQEVQLELAVPKAFRSEVEHGRVTAHFYKPRALEIGLIAARWGAHGVGRLTTTARSWGGMLTRETTTADPGVVKVYPYFERLQRGLPPPITQVFTGNYVARSAGEGLEFAQVRPYTTGDSVRRVNWRVSTRRGALHVNEFHPERNSDVVLFLDTFSDMGLEGSTTLDLAVRAASSLAQHYLRQKDRVGLVSFGGIVSWLTAALGQRQLYRIVEYLLRVGATPTYVWREIDYLPRRSLPPMSMVIAISPLVDERVVKGLIDLHTRGFPVVVVDTLNEELVPAGKGPENELAHRVWRLQHEALRFDLASFGIATVRWDGHASLDAVLAQIPRMRSVRAIS